MTYYLPSTGILGGADALSTDGLSTRGLALTSCPTAEDYGDLMLRWLPQHYGVYRPILYGAGAMLATVDCIRHNVGYHLKPSGASGKWLTLLLEDGGFKRATGESDASYRARFRDPVSGITKSNLEAIADAILVSYSAPGSSEIIEHWAGADFCDTDVVEYAAICDTSYIYDEWHTFTLIIPDLGSLTHPAIFAIINSINAYKLSGVLWYLVVR